MVAKLYRERETEEGELYKGPRAVMKRHECEGC